MSTHSEGFVYEAIYCGKNEKTKSSSTGEKTENKTDDNTPVEEVISKRKTAVQEFTQNLNKSTKKQKKDTENEEQVKKEVTSSAKIAVKMNVQDITTTTQLKKNKEKISKLIEADKANKA